MGGAKKNTTHPAYRRISDSAKELNDLLERWLNPPEWLDPLAARIDAADDFADVPADARPRIRQSAFLAAAKYPRLKKRTQEARAVGSSSYPHSSEGRFSSATPRCGRQNRCAPGLAPLPPHRSAR